MENFNRNEAQAAADNAARQQAQQQPAPAPSTTSPTSTTPPTGEINMAFESTKLAYAQAAAQQAYLNERQRLIDVPMLDIQRDRLALERSTQTGLEAYRQKDLELRQLQLTQSAEQFQQTLLEQRQQFEQQQQLLQAQLAEQTRQFNVGQAEQQRQFNVTATGYLPGGAPTLAREAFAAQQQAEAYLRAANPARAFENELARGAQGQNPSLAANLVLGQPAAAGAAGPAGVDLANVPVRVPAVVNAFRQGAGIPTAGQFAVPSTVAPASQAALSESDFRLQNQKTTSRLSPIQNLVLQSYGAAGGVSPDLQSFYATRGRPPATETTGSYALR